MAILYVAAESAELQPFANLLTGLRKLKWPIAYAYEGILEGRRILLAANGAGPQLASRAVEVAVRAVTAAELSSSRLEAIISTGFCGALSSSLREAQVVVGSEVVDVVRNEVFVCTPATSSSAFALGRVLSQDRIAVTAAEKEELGRKTDCIAVDMESAAVAERTKRATLPFACIKVVSDRANESFGFDLNAMRAADGRIARGKIVSYALSHPGVVPELFRLKKRADGVAKVLGEFLVSCRINTDSQSVSTE